MSEKVPMIVVYFLAAVFAILVFLNAYFSIPFALSLMTFLFVSLSGIHWNKQAESDSK